MAYVTNILERSIYPHQAGIVHGHLCWHGRFVDLAKPETDGVFKLSDDYYDFLQSCAGDWFIVRDHANGGWHIEFELEEDWVRYNITMHNLPKLDHAKIL